MALADGSMVMFIRSLSVPGIAQVEFPAGKSAQQSLDRQLQLLAHGAELLKWFSRHRGR